VKAQFSSYDTNSDGYIERTEVSSTNNSQSETPKQ
jgi:Ca2+-binding EF-hand superfamily protein